MAIASVVFLVLILLNVANSIVDRENRPYWIGAAVVSCGVLCFEHYLPIFDGVATMEYQKRLAKVRATAYTSYAPSMVPPTQYFAPSISTPVNATPPVQSLSPPSITRPDRSSDNPPSVSPTADQVILEDSTVSTNVVERVQGATTTPPTIPATPPVSINISQPQLAAMPPAYAPPMPPSAYPAPTTVFVTTATAPAWTFAPAPLDSGNQGLLKSFLTCSGAYFLGLIGGLICSRFNNNRPAKAITKQDETQAA